MTSPTLRIAASLIFAASTAALAQQPRQYTTPDYAAAEKFMGYNMSSLANKGVVKAPGSTTTASGIAP